MIKGKLIFAIFVLPKNEKPILYGFLCPVAILVNTNSITLKHNSVKVIVGGPN